MIFRIILMFIVLTTGAAGVLYLASCTDFFNAVRVKRLARNFGLVAAGGIVAALVIGALAAISA
jgi:Ni/Fe-hydrogenase subunit HybB-like protein